MSNSASVVSTIFGSPSATVEIIQANFQMLNDPGSISVPGVKAGDVIISMITTGQAQNFNAVGAGWFEPIVSANDEIQQFTSFAGPSPTSFVALLYRGL